jgi:lactoylglutathione lyase
MMIRLELDHVSLLVQDRDESARFYGEVLGLPKVKNLTGRQHIRWFGLGGGRTIHLIAAGGAESSGKRPRSTHFAMATPDFDEVVRRLGERGVAYQNLAGTTGEVAVRPDGVRQVYFQDPDGHWVEINDAPPV